ncbi:hypothetical protein [Sporosarcina sp. JAI121]|uniref:hypothetical protein n=1 Tax=Sporosarcina sp. JAI121 TaxID=2723064 RepID=UPI0015CC15C9|nr:hypothetical protein [Sporosarcina sp. JAI121]NYF25737.1 hypothetical protein [Sporosarcina sp. JAI121]
MMQQGNWHGNQMQHGHHQMHHCNQAQPVVCPPQYRCHDQFVPREVPFIHPIVNVNRVHTVEIPRHYFTETTENVMGQTLPAQPGFGPGYGPGPGFGPGFGPGCGPGFGGKRRRCRR